MLSFELYVYIHDVPWHTKAENQKCSLNHGGFADTGHDCWVLLGFEQLKELQMVIYEKLQKKWSFWFKKGINYKLSYLEHNLFLPPIAQLVEHQTSDQDVMSSSLTWGSILFYARLCTVISHCALPLLIYCCQQK